MKFASIGTSMITEKYIAAALETKRWKYQGTYSRNHERGAEFVKKFGVDKVYTSLEDLAADGEIDAVYVASPNALHFQQSCYLLRHKKHVICEKPLASNSYQVEQMLDIARQEGVILMEAMKSVYAPAFECVEKEIDKLGTIRQVQFQFCQYSSRYDNFKLGKIENAFNPALSNGALMDIGVYCVYPIALLFGMPKRIQTIATKLHNGIDGQGGAILEYDGFFAQISYSKVASACIPSQIQGEEACLLIDHISKPINIQKISRTGDSNVIFQEDLDRAMVHESNAFADMVEGKREVERYQEASSITMKIMDEMRRQINLVFPADSIEVDTGNGGKDETYGS